jgi:hypothetical protein
MATGGKYIVKRGGIMATGGKRNAKGGLIMVTLRGYSWPQGVDMQSHKG